VSVSTPPPRIPRRLVVARDFPESRRSSRPPLSGEEQPVPRSTPGVVSIAGPETLPPDSEACASRHCALHQTTAFIHPAHGVVAAPPPVPLDATYWRRLREDREPESHGPAAS
jgi:hypothetical protein